MGLQRRRLLVVLAEGVGDAEFLEAFGVLEEVSGLAGLVLDAAEAFFDLVEDVAETHEVLLGAFEFSFGLAAFGLVLGDAGRFLEDDAAFLGVGLKEDVHLALLDEAVGIDADARVHEEFADVAQAAGLAVQEVLGLAATVEAAADLDLGDVDRQPAARIVEGKGGFREAEAPPAFGAGEDDVGHFAAAKALRALLAENPLDGVHDVRLAAPVRAHNHRDARVEIEAGAVGERLEAEYFQSLQFHFPCAPSSGVVPPVIGYGSSTVIGLAIGRSPAIWYSSGSSTIVPDRARFRASSLIRPTTSL